MQLSGIQKNSTVDYPGLLSAVVFAPGCNYRCFYCHNKELLSPSAPILDMEETKAFLEKRAGLLDGLVISGGEATLQDGLAPFIRFAKGLGYQIKLDTNGSRPEVVELLLKERLLDYVALDYKAPFGEYQALTGMDGGAARQTAELLLSSGTDFELRTTMIPQIGPEKLKKMAGALPALPKYVLQLYLPQPGDTRFLKTLLPWSPARLRRMAEEIRPLQPGVRVRG